MKGPYYKILGHLTDLKAAHPEITMGKHLSTILDEVDLWGISDKDLLKSVEDYMKAIILDKKIHPDGEIDKIIDEGLHLDRFKLYEDADPPPLDD